MYSKYCKEMKNLHGHQYYEVNNTSEMTSIVNIYRELDKKITAKKLVVQARKQDVIELKELKVLLKSCTKKELANIVCQSDLFMEMVYFESEFWCDEQSEFHARKVK